MYINDYLYVPNDSNNGTLTFLLSLLNKRINNMQQKCLFKSNGDIS
jgi:hypothetical protein